MVVSAASGKGGTGKTTVAVNLARTIRFCQFLDCDVEEPNAHLFLKPVIRSRTEVTVPLPVINKVTCTACRKCADFCRYNALAVLGEEVLVFPEVCHYCGGCKIVCPANAITEKPMRVGMVEQGVSDTIDFMTGTLDIGQPLSIPIVHKMKGQLPRSKTVIIDAPPGTTCPMVEAVTGSDFCILVTEPTPFGLNDLKLAVEVMCGLEIPFGVVINQADIGNDEVVKYCGAEEIPVLLELPYDRRIAEQYSRGNIIVDALPEYREHFNELYKKIKDLIND